MNANQVACPRCGQIGSRAAASCVRCGAAYPSSATVQPMAFAPQPQAGVPMTMRCSRCQSPVMPGFVACPMCGTATLAKPAASTGLIALMHGSGVAAMLLLLGGTFASGTEQAAGFILILCGILVVTALTCAFLLVIRPSMVDKVNGYSVIALQAIFVMTVMIYAASHRRANEPTPTVYPTGWGRGYVPDRPTDPYNTPYDSVR